MQFFTHPVVYDEMNRKWHGRDKCMKKTWRGCDFKKDEWRSWAQLLLFRLLCVFDLVFSPILLLVFSKLKKTRCRQRVNEDETGTTHYLKFLFYVKKKMKIGKGNCTNKLPLVIFMIHSVRKI